MPKGERSPEINHILDIVAAMNRAKASGRTDSEQTHFDRIEQITQEYFALIEKYLDVLPLNEVLEAHMLVIACGFWHTGIDRTIALFAGIGLANCLLTRIESVYKDGPKRED